MPTDHGPEAALAAPGARPTASVGCALQALEIERRGRGGRAHRPGARRDRAARAPRARSARSSAHVGAACRPPSLGAAARITARSISRARLAWISWPATARSSDCATVPVRIGRSPRSACSVSPSSGSPANRRRNSEWSSSRPSTNRTCSTPASLCAATRSFRRALHRLDALEPAVDADRRAVDAVADDAARVARVAAREAQRVRPFRAELGADHVAEC